MPKFLLAYHGGSRPATKEEGMAHMTKWREWIASLGDAVIDPGMFLGMSKTVSTDGVADDGGSNPLAGITIIEADNMEAALEMTGSSPHMNLGGTIEVAQIMDMGG